MQISSREKYIVSQVLQNPNSSIKSLASTINMNERTIYREINTINDWLKAKYSLELIVDSHQLLQISGKESSTQDLKSDLETFSIYYSLSQKERINILILILLLDDSYIKLETLANSLMVSASTIKNDLKTVNRYLSARDLEVISHKKTGYVITGSEMDRAITFLDIVINNIEPINFFNWVDNKFSYSVYIDYMDPYVGAYIKKYYRLIIQSDVTSNFSDIAIQELTILLTFWRIEILNHPANISSNFEHNTNLSSNGLTLYEKIISITQALDELQGNEFAFYSSFLYWILLFFFPNKESNNIKHNNFKSDIGLKTSKLIDYVELNLGININENVKHINDLKKHVDKAYSRVNSGYFVNNPLKSNIKTTYSMLFEYVSDGVDKIFGSDFFPDDEIAFIVLYFALMIDNMSQRAFRVLIICSSGMGSAKMLANRVEREIPEIIVQDVISFTDLHKKNLTNYELVLSTIPLPLENTDYLQVSPLLNKSELSVIKEKIVNHKYSNLSLVQTRNLFSKKEIKVTDFELINEVSEVAIKVISNIDTEYNYWNNSIEYNLIGEFEVETAIGETLSIQTAFTDDQFNIGIRLSKEKNILLVFGNLIGSVYDLIHIEVVEYFRKYNNEYYSLLSQQQAEQVFSQIFRELINKI